MNTINSIRHTAVNAAIVFCVFDTVAVSIVLLVVVQEVQPHSKMMLNVIVFICGEVRITDEYQYNQFDKVHCRPR